MVAIKRNWSGIIAYTDKLALGSYENSIKSKFLSRYQNSNEHTYIRVLNLEEIPGLLSIKGIVESKSKWSYIKELEKYNKIRDAGFINTSDGKTYSTAIIDAIKYNSAVLYYLNGENDKAKKELDSLSSENNNSNKNKRDLISTMAMLDNNK